MIDSLEVTFTHNGLEHTIKVSTEEYGNIPYDMAEMIKELIHYANANPDIIIGTLIDTYNYKKSAE